MRRCVQWDVLDIEVTKILSDVLFKEVTFEPSSSKRVLEIIELVYPLIELRANRILRKVRIRQQQLILQGQFTVGPVHIERTSA
jgi:hypothetical protein